MIDLLASGLVAKRNLIAGITSDILTYHLGKVLSITISDINTAKIGFQFKYVEDDEEFFVEIQVTLADGRHKVISNTNDRDVQLYLTIGKTIERYKEEFPW